MRRGLLPRTDREFFERFAELAAVITEASTGITRMITDGPEAGGRTAETIKLHETHCDTLVGRIITFCEDAQGPPFEPEDMVQLATLLDDIIDWTERFASRFTMYREGIDQGAGLADLESLARIVTEGIRATQRLIDNMGRGGRDIEPLCLEIHRLETQADSAFHAGLITEVGVIQALINSADSEIASLEQTIRDLPDPLDANSIRAVLLRTVGAIKQSQKLSQEVYRFIILREVMRALESASDATDKATFFLRRMVMKNG